MSRSAFRRIKQKINDLKKKAEWILHKYEYSMNYFKGDSFKLGGIEYDEKWKSIRNELATYGLNIEIERVYHNAGSKIYGPDKGRARVILTKIGSKSKNKKVIEISPDQITIEKNT